MSCMVRVYLDTNMLLALGRHKADIFTQIEQFLPGKPDFCVVGQVLDELKRLTDKGSREDRMAARLALVLIKQKDLKVVRSSYKKNADDALVAKACEGDYVATQDKELKRRLKEKNIKILTLKNKTQVGEG